ncbi:conserved hypothetical protein [Ricinus communis]|uniref:Uncharacterized protein n=1 Tax=Ricinus communis TaxID=3988 RepID=B9RDG9_RICCO|nr:conserved hypothetical protein [Ricinus communis]
MVLESMGVSSFFSPVLDRSCILYPSYALFRLCVSLSSPAVVSTTLTCKCPRQGIAISNAGTTCSEDVADIAVSLLIDPSGKISASDWYAMQGSMDYQMIKQDTAHYQVVKHSGVYLNPRVIFRGVSVKLCSLGL